MSLTQYAPQIFDAFRQVVAKPAASARVIVPGLAVVVGGQALAFQFGAVPAGLGLSALAVAAMGFFWQRALTQGEELAPVQLALRFALWTVVVQLLQGFELAPTILFNILLKDVPNADLYTRTGLQLFQLLVGGLYLMPAQLALGRWKDLLSTRLQEMVLAAGLAVGLGYVVINLPFMVAGEVARALFIDFAPNAGEGVVAMVNQSIHALNVMVVSGYFALVWGLLKDMPSRLDPAADEPEAGEPKERRTTRINRTTKAKR
jgi:uncharacterized membrane protein